MIYLNKNLSSNKLNLTLSCDTILTGLSNSYTLKLYSGQIQNPVSFSMNDVSIYKDRYNLFYVSGSTLSAMTNGYYNYDVINSAYSATTLETGKCILTSNTTHTSYVDKAKAQVTKYVDNR